MKVSVIIPVYNEEADIAECLESLGAQKFEDFEIIVVDDGSSDNTKKAISEIKSFIDMVFLSQSHKGPAAARNLGAKKARGRVLVFVDADMEFDKHFLQKLTQPIFDGKTFGTFTKEEYVKNIAYPWAKSWGMNEGWEKGRRHPAHYPDKQKVFRAILKKEFVKAGGFDSGGYTDDYSLSDKLGYMADNAPGAKVYHKNPDNLQEVFYQAKWAAKRHYKFGLLGIILSMARALALPFSPGTWYKAVNSKEPRFIIFRLIYGIGIFLGILEYYVFHKGLK